jgi:retinol dehydrogenase 12
MLYAKDAKVYIAARSQAKADDAIRDIKASVPKSKGILKFLKLDLADLSTIRSTVEAFLAKESRLHVLFNNAGLQSTSPNKTVQGHEIQMGVNCIGTFLFTKLLTPTLAATAKEEPAGSVRVVWVSSSGTEIGGEKNVGVPMDNLDYHVPKGEMYKYGISKTGNYLQGVEYAKRHRADGIVSVPLNPGNLRSELYRDQPRVFKLATELLMHPPAMGANTELFAGFSPELSLENSGAWG